MSKRPEFLIPSPPSSSKECLIDRSSLAMRDVPQGRTAPMLGATNDHDAVELFLAGFQDSPNTLRAYRKECRRFLIWTNDYVFKRLSHLTLEDMLDFKRFLLDPPLELIGNDRAPIQSPEWRPFRQKLNGQSLHQALRIVNSLLSWLVAGGYVSGNPMGLIKKKQKKTARTDGKLQPLRTTRHQLTPAAVSAIYHWIDAQPRATTDQAEMAWRNDAVFTLFMATGARRSELSSATFENLHCEHDRWWLYVVGKGGDTAKLAITTKALEVIKAYRACRGLTPLPGPNETGPLIARLGRPGDPVSDNMIYRIIRAILQNAAKDADEIIAHQLARASTHWLRHTSIGSVAEETQDLRLVQQFGRHASADTTMGYLHEEDNRFHDSVVPHLDAVHDKRRR